MQTKQKQRKQRHKRIRAKVIGTKDCPRFCVFKSNQHIYAQIIDDEKGHTIISAKDLEIKEKLNKMNLAGKVGELVAKKAVEKGIKRIIFDRGGYRYHGIVKAIAEGAKKGGLKF